ncbi:MAG: 2OG-Fe(II) oxygenase [Myxococcaceae bacterium]|nr:2OG-Fe(II) oxygenase [Myxococcaceae bacterium]
MKAEECDALVAAAERQGFEATGRRYPDGYRNNDRLVRDDAELAAWLFERIRSKLPGEPLGLNPRFRFCRYRDGQQFTVHRDGAWAPSPAARTTMTVQVYLNDGSEFEGGATCFTEAGLRVMPEKGLAIVFDHRLWHAGEAVTRGTKYVLRTDVLYPYEAPAVGVSGSGALREVERFTGHLGYVWSAVAGVVSGSRDGTVRRWPSGEVLLRVASSVTCVGRDAAGRIWAGTRAGDVYCDGRRVYGHEGAVLAMTALGDGRIATAGAEGVVRVEDASTPLGGGWVWSLCEREGVLVAGCGDGTVRSLKGVVERHPAPVHAVSRRCVGLADGRVVCEGREVGRHGGIVTGLVELKEHVASSSEDGTLALWDRRSGLKLGEGRCDDFVRSVAADGGQGLVTASYDGTVRRWTIDINRV